VNYKKIIVALGAFLLGVGAIVLLHPSQIITPFFQSQHEIVGFLPYWLLDRADKDYTKYLTTLTYFGLTISDTGEIQKYTKPTESEPGWNSLKTGKLDKFFTQTNTNNIKLSLLVFGTSVTNPVSSAAVLVNEVSPTMKQYGFTDLNLDIENVSEASDSARNNFTVFVSEVKRNLDLQNLGTLTIDVSPTDLIKKRLIDPLAVAPFADHIVLMTYDFHYPGSSVTGPVAPLSGVGNDTEYDTETAIKVALNQIPPAKIILGVPLYGYEWESLTPYARSAVIPTTGQVASNRRVEDFLASCATCSAALDPEAQEMHLVFKDNDTNTFHQIFYPDSASTQAKINLADKYQLGGLALWALGYEGQTILNPLTK